MREVAGQTTWGVLFARAREGAAAIEVALTAPLLLMLIGGIVCYGGYFWTAHSVQQMANDAARAAIAGLDDTERRTLAADAMNADLVNLALPKANATLTAARDGPNYVVRVAYDARRSPFWAFASFIPMPERQVTRSASIRLGGF